MTTVSFDGHTLAADRRGSSPNGIVSFTKLRRTKDGRLLGAAGTWTQCVAFMDWLEKPKSKRGDRPEFKEPNFNVLEVSGGKIMYHDEDGSFEVEDASYAVGSGSHYARAGMALGLSASEAVKLAARFDTGTGYDVDILEVN